MMQQTAMQAVAESGPASPVAGVEGTKDMRAHASQVKIVALCALLLALFTPALAGCGPSVPILHRPRTPC
ncbi:MAG TPA: hypothetical protein VFN11_01400 [Ktedonobacterales bacterium]|nr:hypothetical protein [Ktedonobacterales bacterium]